MAINDSAGLLFRITSDSSQARTDFKQFKKELNDIESEGKKSGSALDKIAASAGLSADQFSKLQTVALGSVAAIGAVAGDAVGVTSALFNLAKEASDYGSEIFD